MSFSMQSIYENLKDRFCKEENSFLQEQNIRSTKTFIQILFHEKVHIELWYVPKKNRIFLDFHYEQPKGNQNFFDFLQKELKNDKYVIEDREDDTLKGKILRSTISYDPSIIINNLEVVFNDIRTMYNILNPLIKFYEHNTHKENTMQKESPLNQILYGPPGTGKTYNTINKALEIINGTVPNKREDAKKHFDELVQAKQIEFVTFHQSYGYEEFIEGIKAVPPKEKGNENGAKMIYKVVSGIFKKVSNRAKENYENSNKTTTQLIQEKSLKQKIEQFLNDTLEAQSEFTKTKGGKFKIKDLSENSISIFTQDSNYSENLIELDIGELTKILSSEIDIKTSRQLAKDIFGINNQRQKDTYYFSILKKFKEIKFDNFEEIEEKEPLKNYVLIIDEINRGNISKIFGELITLIEPSKRIGTNEALYVKLPYSGESFGVPANLYIIGTMNTADRSIALMDTALRRRFEFTEMMPDTKELEGIQIDGINIAQLLETINKRIEYLYDRDHTIGHAYFISLKETPTLEALDGIFKNKIIPLLQEYFYDDWEKIQMVLGDHPKLKVDEKDKFVVEASQKSKELFGFIHDDIDEQTITYSINEHFSKEAYLKLCNAF